MDFMTAVRTCVQQKYADFSGRARRSEYWWFVLFNIILGIVAAIIDKGILGSEMGLIGIIVSLALLIPGIAVGVRRLHDLGKSGWWLLVALIPLIGAIILIWWFIQEGTPGDNEYGPNPDTA
jgi:uncharacterized membrane protein YhaH (DUF805 family)